MPTGQYFAYWMIMIFPQRLCVPVSAIVKA